MTVLAFMGVLLADLGARIWFVSQRTTETVFDVVPSSDSDAIRIDYPAAWFDIDYISHRGSAVMILLFGMVIFVWALREIFKKPDDSAA
ncbi:MAG TPA: hypothetical protein VK742_00415 [Candidatus Sulfotelmatobacter sp.]|nr:hypothetical protein [Candidatus Sulfotelmatobacter sp.]